MADLYLGFARRDINPDKPIKMNSQNIGVEIWHSIFAHALYFATAQKKCC